MSPRGLSKADVNWAPGIDETKNPRWAKAMINFLRGTYSVFTTVSLKINYP